MTKFIVHYGIHFLLPLVLALVFYRKQWLKAYALMLFTFVIDLDHLLATPMFDANRCSIGFHPLHSYVAIAIYAVLSFVKLTRILGIGLIIHILADASDCWLL